MPAKHWLIAPPAPDSFLQSVPEHPLLAQVLYNRGLRSAAQVRSFLAPNDAVANNPFSLVDMVPAVRRIVQAIRQGETICVYGDFDVDGVTATVLLVSALRAAGGNVGQYIPNRVDEGYGLNREAVARVAAKASLLVTVDCGIRSVAEVAYARQLGMDVIVTDHHTVGAVLPAALAVINPHRTDCPTTFDGLAGVGVAYRLAQGVLRSAAQTTGSRLSPDQAAEVEESLLDLVALGTVADMMPLLGENRTLVRRGLAMINAAPRCGLDALMQTADLKKGSVDTTAIAFRLAPRINAAGRLQHASLAYELLRTNDPTVAFNRAKELDELNQRRQTMTATAQAEAEEQLAAVLGDDPPILLVSSERFDHGIVGLVAGKLTDRFYRPAAVMRQEADETRGSARSIPEFDISAALDAVDHLLVRHGGHRLAAGFTVKTAELPAFRAALSDVAAQQLGNRDALRPTLAVDAEVQLDDLSRSVVQQFGRLEPTGHDNPAPVLVVRACRVRGVHTVGKGKHLKLSLDSGPGSTVWDAVGFNLGSWKENLQEGSLVDIACQVEIHEWKMQRTLQLNLQDLQIGNN